MYASGECEMNCALCMSVFVLSGRNLNTFVTSGDKSHFSSEILMQRKLRMQLYFDTVVLFQVTLSFHILPPLHWLSGVEGENAKKTLGVGECWECLERTKVRLGSWGRERWEPKGVDS